MAFRLCLYLFKILFIFVKNSRFFFPNFIEKKKHSLTSNSWIKMFFIFHQNFYANKFSLSCNFQLFWIIQIQSSTALCLIHHSSLDLHILRWILWNRTSACYEIYATEHFWFICSSSWSFFKKIAIKSAFKHANNLLCKQLWNIYVHVIFEV